LPPAREIALRDGTPILVRPIVPKDRLRAGFARLSQESRYRRFMTPLDSLSDQQLRYLTEIDYANHMAWGALDPTQPDQPGVGVARYIRLPRRPDHRRGGRHRAGLHHVGDPGAVALVHEGEVGGRVLHESLRRLDPPGVGCNRHQTIAVIGSRPSVLRSWRA
jgi:hypothetical protein